MLRELINLLALLIFMLAIVVNAQNSQPHDSNSIPRCNLTTSVPVQNCLSCKPHSTANSDSIDNNNNNKTCRSTKSRSDNLTSCSCPDMFNLVEANATNPFGHQVAPKTASERVNFTYLALFNKTINNNIEYNISELGNKLALLNYNITIVNKGNVNINDIEMNDSLLGSYYLGDLTPGQKATINPRLTITKDKVRYCFINSTANITGIDRCCKLVYLPFSDSYSINLEQLGYVLHNYNTIIKTHATELEDGKHNLGDLEVFAGILSNQSNRVRDFEDLIREKWSYLPN